MRVTTSLQYDLARSNIARTKGDTTRIRQNISTGQRVHSFADDPRAAARILRERVGLADVSAHRASAQQAQHLLGVTENALSGVDDALTRVRELTTKFANATYNAQDRAIGAEEVVHLRAQIVELANAQADGRYVFGGLGSAAEPFDAAGVFAGDNSHLEVPITRNTTLAATLPGSEPFVDPAGGPSLFDTLDAIETALRADDGAALSTLVGDVTAHHDRVTGSHQEIGHRFQRIETINAALDRAELAASERIAEAQDTDLVTAVIDLQQTETALQSALAVTGRIDQMSLLSYI